jgi:O-antigen/teichoic acid export membrane protein
MVKLKQFFLRIIGAQLIKSSAIYTVTNFINAAIPFLLLPILTRKLSPSDYGIVAMFQVATGIIYPFVSLTLENAISRKYYDSEKTNFKLYVSNCLLLVFGMSLIMSILLYVFKDLFQELTKIPIFWLKYVVMVIFSQFITSVLLVIYQLNIKPIKYGVIQVLQTILNLSLTILFLFFWDKKWEGRLEAQIITIAIFAIISFIILYKSGFILFKVNFGYIKHAIRFGIPVIPHAVGGILFTAIDRLFLTRLVGLEQTGNYTIAYQIGAIIGLITVAFNSAYVPWLFENLKKNDNHIKLKIVKFTYLYCIALIAGALLLILLFPILIHIFVGGAFKTINTYSLFIVLGFVFNGMYYMVTNYIFYAEKTKLQGILTISVAILKVGITYLFIKWLGAVGASISFCLTYLIFFIVTWVYSNRVYPMPWMLKK